MTEELYWFVPRRRRNDAVLVLHRKPDCGGLRVAMRYYNPEDLKQGTEQEALHICDLYNDLGKMTRICTQPRCKSPQEI